ncbi:MAG TPA: DUF523 domain-containing protein [Epsilonproteobacteria bacterium]|nr:DUF523 domain-containing protein [Campylobacterota bacterium]
MRQVAISACLLGERCRYDATDNYNPSLLHVLSNFQLIPFCPEDDAFGSPRPTMDLIETTEGLSAISNETGADLSLPVETYAGDFFDAHPDISLFIGKDRSPSCGVCSARKYDKEKMLLSSSEAGLMAQEALRRGIESIDAEKYLERVVCKKS